MAKKESQPKQILEREYIVPLRKKWLKVPRYKRANKAIKTLKEFIARHMKIYDRDLKKIKIDVNLNNELRFRGVKKPHPKIKVRAIKFDNDIVKVELINLPKHIEFQIKREEKLLNKKDTEESKKESDKINIEKNKKENTELKNLEIKTKKEKKSKKKNIHDKTTEQVKQ